MFQGLRTVIYPVSDVNEAKAWYSALLGQEPYFDQPFYVGYTVGGFELGLDPSGAPAAGGGPTVYWGVEDIHAAYVQILDRGAGAHTPVTDVGDGILTAVVMDPFGNPVGLISNPHFSVENVR